MRLLWYAIVSTDGYSKLTPAILAGRSLSSLLAKVLFDSWASPYSILFYVLADNGVQFTSSLFATLRTMLGIKPLTRAPFHSQTNGQLECYKHTIVTRLGHYVSDDQID